MAAVWPGGLPQVAMQGQYNEEPPTTAIRSQMDTGPAKIRQRYTAGPRPVQITLPLSAAEVEILDVFHVTTLKGGSLPFDWKHPRTQANVSMRFRRAPGYTDQGSIYLARLDLEILP
jgi:hypothetical protein